ncbi:MAG TPA: GYF domain-containing protein [Polyangiales bacterium]|nr:GYF domain-containing protein [Polyangiales bacterium]
MKFLCRNCKAKYQIADEKVAGRTLRMTCQQCGEPIVVRGPTRQTTGQIRQAVAAPLQAPAPAFAPQAVSAQAVAPAAIGAKATGQALAAELGRHVPPPPPEPAPQEEWHVAINDEPVGPLRRDDVARRISQGEIHRESLAWREGMDDWMPIKHIAELTALFAPPAPAPARSTGALVAPQPIVTAPAARTDMAPIGGRKVVPVETYDQPYEAQEPSEPPAEVAVATVASPVVAQPVVAQDPSAKGQPGWAQMFALVSGGAFILAAGALLGVRVLAPNQAPPPAAAAPVAVAPVQPPAAAAAPAEPERAEDPSGAVIELDMQAIDGRSGTARKPTSTTGTDTSADKKKGASGSLTAEQRAMLERMGGGLDQGPSNIRAPSEGASTSNGQGSGQLTAAQLSGVVLNGRKNLQRCYETALRGQNSTETVRLDVEIQVSPNGNVTSVHASGKGLPGMDDCITRTVKMWRFPKSGEVTQTRFPVVFQPGA